MICLIATLLSISEMSLEEKAGQVLMPHLLGDATSPAAEELIQNIQVGGIVYFNWANDLSTFEKVQHLSASLQKQSKIPLLIAIDQEGGRVSRLREDFPPLESPFILGQKNDLIATKQAAKTLGARMVEAGINLNLAPLVDIVEEPTQHPLKDRSYGNTSEKVIQTARPVLEGFREANLLTTLKHFPGHGAARTDSHYTLPVITKSLSQLEAEDIAPFFALAPLTDAIMIGHLLVPALDPTQPSTLSEPTLTYLKTHFQGALISDSLIMEALCSDKTSIEEIALNALKAGCDILLLGGKNTSHANIEQLTPQDIRSIRDAIVEAVLTQTLQEERLNDAVQKIFQLKMKIARLKNFRRISVIAYGVVAQSDSSA